MLRAGLAGAIALLTFGAVAQPVSIPVGAAMTFKLAGTPPKPGPAHRGALGTALPGPGEITVGLAPAGNAVQIAKLHVYERTPAPVAFEAAALRGGKTLVTQKVCGRVEMDAWVTVPSGTQKVVLSGFTLAKTGCGS